MALDLSVLYRGPLSSCNYDCPYCPFAKQRSSAAELAADRQALARFTAWLGQQPHRFAVLFTPWGEALPRAWYRTALVSLSHQANIRRVAIQTNLSCPVGWTREANRDTLALWATYHPGEVTQERFLRRCRQLSDLGIRYSVGVVGLREHFPAIAAMHAALPADVYLWINAFKRNPEYYSAAEVAFLTRIDPHFPVNNCRHPSLGRACRTGAQVFSVDGAGTMRRCHFVAEVIGNIYQDDWLDGLRPRPCPNATCGCFIGYAHLEELNLEAEFGAGLLERIPTLVPSRPRLTPLPPPAHPAWQLVAAEQIG